MSEVLANNYWLSTFDLRDNPVNKRTVNLYLSAMEERQSLCDVKLTIHDPEPAPLYEKIKDVQERNRLRLQGLEKRSKLSGDELSSAISSEIDKAAETGVLLLSNFAAGEIKDFEGNDKIKVG